MPRSRIFVVALAAAFATAFAACGSAGNEAVGDGAAGTHDNFKADDGRLRVATTVAPLTSIVLNIGGDRVHIHGLIPDGVDSHTYEPRPSDAQVLARADLLIMNGAHLEGTTEAIAKANLRDPGKIYKLADNTLSGDDEKTGFLYDFSFPRADGNPNPHLWMNPKYALKYADLVRTWLSENDPENASYYQGNYDRFAAVLTQLDAAIRKDSETVPAENRKLLTYHDSWAYWAREYGWTVIGAIQPSDFKEPSAKELADLITQIKREKVLAVFGSEVFPSKTMETIARETGAVFEDRLSDDAPPGKESEAGHTYVGMLVEDMRILFPRLGGNAGETAKIPITNTFDRTK
ncbi:MAG: zinc ABC transporter substrate-binding protein [Chloroflexi bacterium]|nr:zinc ABC transporter substrate-binding protein [Chloroflexota bacterium]